jgi:hypothetical protein
MSEPWEDFGGGQAVAETPPWEDFGSSVPEGDATPEMSSAVRWAMENPRKALLKSGAKDEMQNVEQSRVIEKVLGAIGGPEVQAMLPTGSNLINAIPRAINYVVGKPIVAEYQGLDLSGLSKAVVQPVETALQATYPGVTLTQENSPVAGAGRAVDALAGGLTHPDVVATLPAYASGIPEALALPAQAARIALAGQMASELPAVHQHTSEVAADPNASVAQKTEAGLGQVITDLITIAMGKAGMKRGGVNAEATGRNIEQARVANEQGKVDDYRNLVEQTAIDALDPRNAQQHGHIPAVPPWEEFRQVKVEPPAVVPPETKPTPIVPPPEVVKPDWVTQLETIKEVGMLSEKQTVDLEAWYKDPNFVPEKAKKVEPPVERPVGEESTLIHDLNNALPTKALKAKFETESSGIYDRYLQHKDFAKAQEELTALKQKVAEFNKPKAEPPKVEIEKFDEHHRADAQRLEISNGAEVTHVLEKMVEHADRYRESSALASFLLEHYRKEMEGAKVTYRPGLSHTRAVYYTREREIGGLLHTQRTLDLAVIHEAAHAATHAILENPKTPRQVEMVNTLRDLRFQARRAFKANLSKYSPEEIHTIEYGLKNNHEFIAVAFNRPIFRDFLNSIKAKDRTLWERVKHAIKGILGIEEGSILDRQFDALIEGQKEGAVPPRVETKGSTTIPKKKKGGTGGAVFEDGPSNDKGLADTSREGVYGHWIRPDGSAITIKMGKSSHEREALNELKKLVKDGRMTQAEYDKFNIPLNSTTEVEDALFKRGYQRGVFNGPNQYAVNNDWRQLPNDSQKRALKNYGKEHQLNIDYFPETYDTTKSLSIHSLSDLPPGPDPLPFRYKSYAEEKRDAATPQGVGKIPVLWRLFGDKRGRGLPEENVLRANTIGKLKADTGVALWLEKKKTAERAFPLDENGQVTLADGSKGFMSDVIEGELRNPGSQPLTAVQKKFVQDWKEINAEGVRYAQQNGVKFFLDENGKPRPIDEAYFGRPRIPEQPVTASTVMGKVKEFFTGAGKPGPKSVGTGSKPGAKQSSFKQREYATEAEGVKNGVKYEPDEYLRAAEWLKSVYRAVADARLAKDPALKGRAGIRLVPSGIHAPKGGPMLLMPVGKGPKYGEATVFGVPALEGRVFPQETARKIQDFYQAGAKSPVNYFVSANNALKAIKFTMDVSAPFNQGLLMMYYRPGRWAKATAESYKALIDGLAHGESGVLSRYLNVPENAKAAREIVENGGSLVRLQDFLAGAEHGGLVEKIPYLRRPIRASAQSMGTFLSIAKIEMYKALEPALKKGETRTELVEAIDNLIGSGRMEQLGMGKGRALTERLLFNAPSYLRAFANLTVQAATGGISGKVARRGIVGMLGGVSATMFAAYKAQGLSDDEIKERFDPRSSKYMRIAVPMADGQTTEISYGNVFLSFVRLVGDATEVAQGTKELGSGDKKNPFLRWLSYRKSPVVDFAIQSMITGKDFKGLPTGFLESLGRGVTPLPIEPALDKATGKLTGKAAATEAGAQFLGLNAFTKETQSMVERSRSKFHKELADLPLKDRLSLARDKNKETKPSLDAQEVSSVSATENEFQRRREVQAALSGEAQKFLKENKLTLPQFSTGFEINNLQVPMTMDERKAQQEFIVEEYEKSIAALIESKKLEQFRKDGSLQRRLQVILTDANARARMRIHRMILKQTQTPTQSQP